MLKQSWRILIVDNCKNLTFKNWSDSGKKYSSNLAWLDLFLHLPVHQSYRLQEFRLRQKFLSALFSLCSKRPRRKPSASARSGNFGSFLSKAPNVRSNSRSTSHPPSRQKSPGNNCERFSGQVLNVMDSRSNKKDWTFFCCCFKNVGFFSNTTSVPGIVTRVTSQADKIF